ncbi:hypothetical protein Goshw_015494, partial [Gossypium schwendimanii]|nr:hypothetical protein [Gossypium schwendimanii]
KVIEDREPELRDRYRESKPDRPTIKKALTFGSQSRATGRKGKEHNLP